MTREMSNRTVDLTRLRGANATRLADFDVSDGEYGAVFVHVSDVNGALTNGEQVRVKLPSGKLKLNEGFRIGPNASVEFVFDVTVKKAGKSGKYVLQPVVSESGTDVPIERVDEEGRRTTRGVTRSGATRARSRTTRSATSATAASRR